MFEIDEDELEDVLIENDNIQKGGGNMKINKNRVRSRIAILFIIEILISLLIVFCLFKFCNEVSTFFAYNIIILIIGLLCAMTSFWAENKELRLVSTGIAFIGIFSFIVALIIYFVCYA